MFHCVSIIRIRQTSQGIATTARAITRKDAGPLSLATINQYIYDAFGIPNRSDVFTFSYLTDTNILDHVVICDGKYA